MALTAAGTPEPPALFVRAMYDYNADDYTSLSFRQGDIIQVLNQLETGWWDGVIDNVRGWFPSNYCAIVTDPVVLGDRPHGHESSEEDYDDARTADLASNGSPHYSQATTIFGEDNHEDEEEEEEEEEEEDAAFWIPQATPEGRLFYFNTLTGSSTMELPAENTPAVLSVPAAAESHSVLDHAVAAHPPPEMMARGFERDEDDYDGSASEAEGESLILASSQDSPSQRRQSLIDGVSPATSMDSLNPPSSNLSIRELKGFHSAPIEMAALNAPGGGNTTFLSSDALSSALYSPNLVALSTPLTWAILVDNMSRATDAYSQALRDGDRALYVARAEDISDHLRMILAAGSDTTDNHSGNPSIISSNKALYPHFRDIMSKFSKLVLWSHIAAGDWAGLDSTQKCIQEAGRVMQSVHSYVSVAKQQRGNSIGRIAPGFVIGSLSGGNWHDNGVPLNNMTAAAGPTTTFLDTDNGQQQSSSLSAQSRPEPTEALSLAFLERLDSLRRSLVANVRRIEDHLSISQKMVTAAEHEQIANAISTAAIGVLEQFRPWISAVESVNLAPLRNGFQNPRLGEFGIQKQRAYDAVADFVLACQAVSTPLPDEWAELRGDSLVDRLQAVRHTTRALDNFVSHIGYALSVLLQQVPDLGTDYRDHVDFSRFAGDHDDIFDGRQELDENAGTIGIPSSYSVDQDPDMELRRKQMTAAKAERFFGHRPPPQPAETPQFLQFDHEEELFYDTRNNVPMVKCGTLPALVEHLTRHDKLDTSFNNTFLITYRSFTTAPELFGMLVDRFNIQTPSGLSASEMQLWIDRKQNPIRFRVVNILKNWFERHWVEIDDEANQELLRKVLAFTQDSVATTKTPGSPQLLTAVLQRMRGQDAAKKLVPTPNTAAPAPIIPKNMKKLRFLDIDPLEFARQLTVIESRLYAKIRPVECLNKTWQKKIPTGDPEPATNVKSLILHSNQLTNWVAEMILTQTDVKKRVVVIKHFVNVADKCRSFNNFSTLTSIISALGTAPIHRLARTWAHVNGRTIAVLEQMRKLMASTKNFGEYRRSLHLANPPCIPFFGAYIYLAYRYVLMLVCIYTLF